MRDFFEYRDLLIRFSQESNQALEDERDFGNGGDLRSMETRRTNT